MNDERVPLSEILPHLEMPPVLLSGWFRHVLRFFARHGGRARYAGLIDLFERCAAQSETSCSPTA